MDLLPDNVLDKICHYLSPKDRLKFQNTCKATKNAIDTWSDSIIVEIRDDEDAPRNAYQPSCSYTKPDNTWFIVKVTIRTGARYTFRVSQSSRNSIRTVKNLLMRNRDALYLRIWNGVLSDEFALVMAKFTRVKALKLWNCGDYFEKKTRNKRMAYSLLCHPNITELLILDSTERGAHHSECTAFLDKELVKIIKSPIINLQLAGVNVPWRAFNKLCEHIAPTCERLSIGCLHGKEMKREKYVAALEHLKVVTDLDLPPFIFYLNDRVPTEVTDSLSHIFDKLPLISLGLRHYNTATLFQYIDEILPLKIRMLRIHHNSSRLPNFSQIGNHNFEEPHKKISMISRHSYLSSSSCEYPHEGTCEIHYPLYRTGSFTFPSATFGQKKLPPQPPPRPANDGSRKTSCTTTCTCTVTVTPTPKTSDAGPGPSNAKPLPFSNLRKEKSLLFMPKAEPPTPMMNKKNAKKYSKPKSARCNRTGSTSSGSSVGSSIFGGRFQFLIRRAKNPTNPLQLDEVKPGERPMLHQRDLTIFTIEERGNRSELKIRQKMFYGISVVFTRECTTVQEVLGRMGSPLKTPHVYSKNANRDIRIVKGDLVKPIPLTSLGMESDYDDSDFEGNPNEFEKPYVPYEFEVERELRHRNRDYSKFRELDMCLPLAISSF